jgi:hypothetical protein
MSRVRAPVEVPEDIVERVRALCVALPEVTLRGAAHRRHGLGSDPIARDRGLSGPRAAQAHRTARLARAGRRARSDRGHAGGAEPERPASTMQRARWRAAQPRRAIRLACRATGLGQPAPPFRCVLLNCVTTTTSRASFERRGDSRPSRADPQLAKRPEPQFRTRSVVQHVFQITRP